MQRKSASGCVDRLLRRSCVVHIPPRATVTELSESTMDVSWLVRRWAAILPTSGASGARVGPIYDNRGFIVCVCVRACVTDGTATSNTDRPSLTSYFSYTLYMYSTHWSARVTDKWSNRNVQVLPKTATRRARIFTLDGHTVTIPWSLCCVHVRLINSSSCIS